MQTVGIFACLLETVLLRIIQAGLELALLASLRLGLQACTITPG